MCYLVTGKTWYSYLGLTNNDAFILIMYNLEDQLLAQAGGKYLRPRPSPVTPIAGFCTHPPCSHPRTCCSPKILGTESCSSPHPASPFSLGIRPDNSGPGEWTASTGSLALFGVGRRGGGVSNQWQECHYQLHQPLLRPHSMRGLCSALWSHLKSVKEVLEPHFVQD